VTERPTVVVVGLGPGGPEYVTQQTLDAIAVTPYRFLRTARHPSASLVPDPITLDHLYEDADRFEDVYAAITDTVVTAAVEHGRVLYAVPGSPLVLERSVRQLLADARIDVEVLPAMSFLEVAWARLGIDPVESRVRVIDGHEFATAAAGDSGPLLVAHAHANWVLSDIKLAADGNDEVEVVILQGLGTPEESITRTTWADLDRTVEADHLTSVYVPRLAVAVGSSLVRFHELTRTLRERCPWDRQQTHESLVKYLVEETFEVVDAINALDPDDPATDDALAEELGDLLYQIEFHAMIAEQEGRFTMADVADGIHDKLVRRHPHVFAGASNELSDIGDAWVRIKAEEKAARGVTNAGPFEGVPTSSPALAYAAGMLKRGARAGVRAPAPDPTPAGELAGALLALVADAAAKGIDAEAALRAYLTAWRAAPAS
jgi:tetrapyrrole methylase family protein/MazG family protein